MWTSKIQIRKRSCWSGIGTRTCELDCRFFVDFMALLQQSSTYMIEIMHSATWNNFQWKTNSIMVDAFTSSTPSHTYLWANLANISSDNDLSPVQHDVISEPVLIYCQLNHSQPIVMVFGTEYHNYDTRKSNVKKSGLQNVSHWETISRCPKTTRGSESHYTKSATPGLNYQFGRHPALRIQLCSLGGCYE